MDSIIKRNLLNTILFFTIIIIVVFSIFLSIFIYKIKIKDAKEIIKDKNIIITLSINTLFLKIKNYIEILTANNNFLNLDANSENSTKEILAIYKKLQKIDPDISYIYSGYENGRLIINNYTPPPGYDPRIRPWYKAALEAYPNISIGVPYQEIKTKEWLISFSKAIKYNNKIIGVLDIDVSLASVVNQIEDCNIVNCYIINKKGKIIIHKNTTMLNKKYQKDNPDNKNKIIYSHFIKSLGWTVISEIERDKIFSPIIYEILICNLIVLMIIFSFSWGLSISFFKNIVYPIMKLKDRVENIIENKNIDNQEYKYPENEIGLIAAKIESLTKREMYKRNMLLKELSEKDELTNLFNRRYLLKELEYEIEIARRYNRKFSIIIFDVDHFKLINDTYGHNAGDEVLKAIAKVTLKIVRITDKVGRWGGEEFLVMCPETDEENAKNLAEKLRKTIEEHKFNIDRQVTMSAGVSEYKDEDTIYELIEKADKKLYQAKKSGRNKVVS